MSRLCVIPGCQGCDYCRWEERAQQRRERHAQALGPAWYGVLALWCRVEQEENAEPKR